MKLRVKLLRPGARPPVYATDGAAGMDVSASIDAPITIGATERAAIPLGVAVEVPVGYEIQVRARSGWARKYGIGMVNGVGTIDSDFRGEAHALLVNHGREPFTVAPGDRVAQFVLAPIVRGEIEIADDLSATERGEAGFGSTGVR